MENLTPMLKQYHQIKAQHKDCILFFRLGDFYEMFYEDATIASGILDLVLTSRGSDKSGKVPMCGIPYHAADNYVSRLIKAGHKVAICEQVQDPALAKGIVKRDVIRTVTSGTFIDEKSTEARYLFSLAPNKKTIGLAFTNTAHGTIQTNEYESITKVIEAMAKLPVYECIFPCQEEVGLKDLFNHPLLKRKNIILSAYHDWCFNPDMARKSLNEHFGTPSLKGYGIDGLNQATASAGALLEYLKQMNKQPMRHIDHISLYSDSDYVFISPAAVYGLELEHLIRVLDKTKTPVGKRAFRYWLYHPLKNPEKIIQRQKAVTLLKEDKKTHDALEKLLRNTPDIEKSISRISCGLTHARDFLALRNTLTRIPLLQEILKPLQRENALFTITDIPNLRQLLEEAINPEIPLSRPEGKILKKGYNSELDELRDLQENGRKWLAHMQATEIKRTGINSLKIGFNKVFGYYIEVTKAKLNNVPAEYIRKQTLVNAERFITPELKEFEEKMLTAQDKVFALEGKLLKKIQQKILDDSAALHAFCGSLACVDATYSLAVTAQLPGYIAPQITENTQITISEGRHPIVEAALDAQFIPNDTILDCEKNHLLVITGPNMSGKSTYIRQVAVLVIMAQMGGYIPAQRATIGVVDKIFTRIGAHDDITKGYSTFMVEMSETAEILNNLSSRSLVILDEIGRGTSTFDGLSLAWAVAEYLQERGARTLFATHFHELTALADERSGVKNYNVAVKEWKDQIVFLHKIIPGGTDDSYGIYVAKLAGIPREVVQRSKKILTQLELHGKLKDKIRKKSGQQEQFMFFTPIDDPWVEDIKKELASLDINSLTPLEAINKMQSWKEKLNNET